MLDPQVIKKILASLSFTFWTGVWIYAIGLMLMGGLRWWTGDLLSPVRLCNYLMPWLQVGLWAGIVLAFLTNRNLLGFSLAVPALFIFVTYAPLFLPRQVNSHDGMHLKIMSYNVWRENSNITEMAGVVRNQKPDLLLLQEIHRDKLRALVAELDDLYPNAPNVVFEEQKLQAMISHFPLQQIDAGSGKGRAQKVIAMTPGGPITVLNIHPSRGNWQRRHKQMSTLLADDIAGDANPLILGGDFNTTDQTQTYRLFDQILKNAHWQAGWGFGFTYPSSDVKFRSRLSFPPLVRIDHIFYSRHFVAQKAATLSDSGGSDHFPIIAELILKSEMPGG